MDVDSEAHVSKYLVNGPEIKDKRLDRHVVAC